MRDEDHDNVLDLSILFTACDMNFVEEELSEIIKNSVDLFAEMLTISMTLASEFEESRRQM